MNDLKENNKEDFTLFQNPYSKNYNKSNIKKKSILCYIKQWHGFHDDCWAGKINKSKMEKYPYPFINYNSHWIKKQWHSNKKEGSASFFYYFNRTFLKIINLLIIVAAVYFAFTRNNTGNPLPDLTIFSIISPIFAFFFPIIYIIWYMISGLYSSLSKN